MNRALTYVAHILEAAEAILSYTKQGKDAFTNNPMAIDAVIRRFEVMGEAAKRLDPEFCAEFPGVPWSGLARFRDLLIHGYDRVDVEQVWNIVTRELPATLPALRRVMQILQQPPLPPCD